LQSLAKVCQPVDLLCELFQLLERILTHWGMTELNQFPMDRLWMLE
jgi:hypothetical protein